MKTHPEQFNVLDEIVKIAYKISSSAKPELLGRSQRFVIEPHLINELRSVLPKENGYANDACSVCAIGVIMAGHTSKHKFATKAEAVAFRKGFSVTASERVKIVGRMTKKQGQYIITTRGI